MPKRGRSRSKASKQQRYIRRKNYLDNQRKKAEPNRDSNTIQKRISSIKIHLPTLHLTTIEEEAFFKRVLKNNRFLKGEPRIILDPPTGWQSICGINSARPKKPLQHLTTKLPVSLQKEISVLFNCLKLKQPPKHSVGVTDEDYGAHGLTVNFVPGLKNSGELILGQYNNEHNAIKGGCGLTKHTWRNPDNQRFARIVVKSMIYTLLPHPISFIRINPMAGGKTVWHTDSMRGTTCNMVLFHDAGGMIEVSTFQEFKTSVVSFQEKQFIPFSGNQGTDKLLLIGLDETGRATMY